MTAMTFRKKPVEVEAMQWTGDNTTEVIDWVLATGHWSARWHEAVGLDEAAEARRPRREHIAVETSIGTMFVMPGDWIIRGVDGEHDLCKPDIFEATYEPVDARPSDLAGEVAQHQRRLRDRIRPKAQP